MSQKQRRNTKKNKKNMLKKKCRKTKSRRGGFFSAAYKHIQKNPYYTMFSRSQQTTETPSQNQDNISSSSVVRQPRSSFSNYFNPSSYSYFKPLTLLEIQTQMKNKLNNKLLEYKEWMYNKDYYFERVIDMPNNINKNGKKTDEGIERDYPYLYNQCIEKTLIMSEYIKVFFNSFNNTTDLSKYNTKLKTASKYITSAYESEVPMDMYDMSNKDLNPTDIIKFNKRKKFYFDFQNFSQYQDFANKLSTNDESEKKHICQLLLNTLYASSSKSQPNNYLNTREKIKELCETIINNNDIEDIGKTIINNNNPISLLIYQLLILCELLKKNKYILNILVKNEFVKIQLFIKNRYRVP